LRQADVKRDGHAPPEAHDPKTRPEIVALGSAFAGEFE
jgi:hypothetical protein